MATQSSNSARATLSSTSSLSGMRRGSQPPGLWFSHGVEPDILLGGDFHRDASLSGLPTRFSMVCFILNLSTSIRKLESVRSKQRSSMKNASAWRWHRGGTTKK
jgi:hypothetical protein